MTKTDDTGKAAATETKADDAQPVEFPLSLEEWTSEQPPYRRLEVAGFRMKQRMAGRLAAVLPRAEWTAAFAAFLKEG